MLGPHQYNKTADHTPWCCRKSAADLKQDARLRCQKAPMPAELAAYAAALARTCVADFAEAMRPCGAGSDAELRLLEVTRSALVLYDVSRVVCYHHDLPSGFLAQVASHEADTNYNLQGHVNSGLPAAHSDSFDSMASDQTGGRRSRHRLEPPCIVPCSRLIARRPADGRFYQAPVICNVFLLHVQAAKWSTAAWIWAA